MVYVVKATERGQITLPIGWRKRFSTNRYIVKYEGDKLEITPLDLEKIEKAGEYTVFDAIRDNKGKGIKAEDLIGILKSIE